MVGVPLKEDMSAKELRQAAAGSSDANQARRLLTLAAIRDGKAGRQRPAASRAWAAGASGALLHSEKLVNGLGMRLMIPCAPGGLAGAFRLLAAAHPALGSSVIPPVSADE